MNINTLHIDIETFSSVSLLNCGVYRYVESPDFEILMLAWSFNGLWVTSEDLTGDSVAPDLFSPGEKAKPAPDLSSEFLELYNDPEVVKVAHNAAFEITCLNEYAKRGGANRKTNAREWRCTMVQAYYNGLQGSLKALSTILNLGEAAKDAAGATLIKHFCIPCKATKTNGGRTRNTKTHSPEKWAKFLGYCAQDVAAEIAVGKKLVAVPPQEWAAWAIDYETNARGVSVDSEFAKSCVVYADEIKARILNRIKDLTGIDNPNSTVQMSNWINSKAKNKILSLEKSFVENYLLTTPAGLVRDVLLLRLSASKSSVKKYDAILRGVCRDGRVRGLFQFYGAFRTGRWAGRMVQVQNLPRGFQSDDDIAISRALIKGGRPRDLELVFGDPLTVVSGLLRSTFVAEPGNLLVVCDYTAIEARVLAWLAGEKWKLDVFNTHGKIYEAAASQMFGIPIENVGKDLRAKGKVGELALGYQGTRGALKNMGADKMGLSDSELDGLVKKWRKSNPAIVDLWRTLERAALSAVASPNKKIILRHAQGLRFQFDTRTNALRVRLPSGRELFYHDPRILEGKYGPAVTYMGSGKTNKWERLDNYGGKWTENIVQAMARDILVLTMLARPSYIMSVHDEIVDEVLAEKAEAAFAELKRLMSISPEWAPDLPLKGAGFVGTHYKK